MYTDMEYRKAIVYKYAIDELWDNDLEKIACSLKSATKTYEFLRCPCCIDIFGTHSLNVLDQTASTILPLQNDATSKKGFYGN